MQNQMSDIKNQKNINSNPFMQSVEWEEFQKAYGRKFWRCEDQLVIKNDLPLGKSYLTCFRPEIDERNIDKFLSGCRNIAQSENSIFFHIEPAISNQRIANSEQRTAKCMQPKQSLILDIFGKKEDILAGMHQKTRYNIRLAEKKGVKIRLSKEVKDVDIFYNLASDTANRNDFHFHSKEYYKKMVEILGKKYNILDLVIGEYENKPLVALIILYYNNQAIYLHGASSNENRNLMAPYLAQWEAIQEAKKRSCVEYDFWGISPLKQEISNDKFPIRQAQGGQISNKFQNPNYKIENLKLKIVDDNHPWAGITKFKLGFAPNGKYVEYPDAQDIVYQKTAYNLYQGYKKLRKK